MPAYGCCQDEAEESFSDGFSPLPMMTTKTSFVSGFPCHIGSGDKYQEYMALASILFGGVKLVMWAHTGSHASKVMFFMVQAAAIFHK